MEYDFRIEPFTFEMDEAEMPTDLEYEGLADEVRRRGPTRRPTPQARRPSPKPRPQRPRQPPRRPRPVAVYSSPYSPPINLINNSATGSEHARWVQSALNEVLGLQLPVNGVMTRETRSAIRSFQKQHDLPQDGKVGPDTERALIEARRPRTAPPAAPPDDAPDEATEEMEWLPEFDFGIQAEDYSSGSQPTVRRGSRGDAVVQLQLRLKSLGFDPGPADGIFGSNTDAAVRAFQSSRRITVDGIVGPQTWGQLYASGSTPPATTPLVSPGTIAARILDEARRHIGFQEGQDNANPFSAYFGAPNVLWCAYFVSYVFTKAGKPLNIGSCDVMLSHLQTNGRFVSNTTTPQPADIVVFDYTQGDHNPAEHVGLVEKVYRNSSGQIRVGTIEGNSGNGVKRNDYPLGDARIVGFGRLGG